MLKLYVACHKPSYVPRHLLLHPIQVGAATAEAHFDGFLHDDSGNHISTKNTQYCELTAQYWAWKNDVSDYYGFFHYRRYLYPDLSTRIPYKIIKTLEEKRLEELNFSAFSQLVEQYDLIAPIGENMHISVRQHYADAPHHHGSDLDMIEAIIREQYPQYVDAKERYLGGTICYFGNIYMMKHQVFRHYCQWLFDILAEFDRRSDLSGYNAQELRVNGYLAERLFGIYYTYQKEQNMCVLELPRVHVISEHRYISQRLMNLILPPGSKIRAHAKRCSYRKKDSGKDTL